MANYEASFRTNYFRVKDELAFKAWAESLQGSSDIEVWPCTNQADGLQRFGLGAYSSIPSSRLLTKAEQAAYRSGELQPGPDGWVSPEDIDEDSTLNDVGVEFDFLAELGQQLAEGEQAIVIEVGSEKLRYLVGLSSLINDKGETVRQVSLDDIYQGQSISSYATY